MNTSKIKDYLQSPPQTKRPLFILAVVVLAFSVSTAWAADKEKQDTKNKKKPVKVEQPYVKDKNKGKPADPGAHGRANAAAKQAASPGKGSKKNGDLEITPLTDKSSGEKDKEKYKKKKKGDKD